jgi:KaiC/GvpD/RAD55 family RecA-like ATPase
MKEDIHFSLYDLSSHTGEADGSYLLNGVLPQRGLVVILGSYGTGKTQLAMRIAAAIATEDYLGHGRAPFEELCPLFCAATKHGYMLYFAGEGKQFIEQRIKAAEKALPAYAFNQLNLFYGGVLPVAVCQVHTRSSVDGHIDEVYNLIMQAQRSNQNIVGSPSVIVFDTLSACYEIKDENNNSEMQRITDSLVKYAEHFNCCVIAITHPPKSHDSPRGYSRGASALINSADVVIQLRKMNTSKYREARITKMRDGPYEGTIMKFKIENFGKAAAFVPVDISPATESKERIPFLPSPRQKEIINLLSNAPGQSLLRSQVVREVTANKADIQNLKSEGRMARREIEKLHLAGVLSLAGKGKAVLLSLKKLS